MKLFGWMFFGLMVVAVPVAIVMMVLDFLRAMLLPSVVIAAALWYLWRVAVKEGGAR